MLGRKSIGVSLGLLVILSASLVECHPHDTPGDPANPCTNNANCQQRVLATNEYPLRYHWVATCAHAATQGPTDFNCTCRTGFEEETTVAARVYDSDGDPATAAAPVPFLCKDINECTAGDPCTVHVSDYSCSNTFGSFTCSCNEGYAPDATGACVDINECDAADPDHNCDCNAQCTNTDGSFTCSCNTGYTTPFDHALRADCHDQVAAPRVKDNNNAIDWDGTTCVDEDECKMCPGLTAQLPDLNNCDAGGSTCYNTEGSFQCVCNTGLQSVDGTGTACTDYTECANSLDDIDWSTTPNSMTALCHGCTFICDGCTGDRSQGPDDAEEYVHPLGTTLEECLTACSDDDWCRAAGFEAATSTCYIQHRKGSMVMIRADAVNNRMTYLKVPEALASDADIGRVRTNLLTTGNECASTCSPNAASDYDYTCSCGANFNSLPSGECVPCGHESTYSHCEDNVCETCPVGTATAGLAACCRRDCLCKAGMVGSYNSAPAHVPEGAAVGCYSCPATFYADTPNNVCQSCPAAAAPNSIWSPKGSDDVNDCLCMVNHFYETTQDISSCPPPFGTAAAPCVQCPAGSTSQGGLGDISSCTCDSSHIRVALPNNNFRCAVRDACSMSSPCPLEGQLCRTDFTSGASKCFCDEANGYFPIQRNGMYGVHVWKLPSAACSVPALAPDDALAFSTVNALALNNNDMALLFNDIVPDNMQPAAGGSWELMAAKFNGRLKIMKGGDYHFCVQSSDGAVLRIFGSVVVSNNGRSTLAEHGKVCTYDHNIAAGDYPVEVDWFSNAGAMGLHVTYSGPDTVGYFNADGTSTQDAVNFIPLPSESSSYGDGEGGCYRQCTVRECTVVLSNHIYDEHLAVNQLHVTVDRDLEIGDSLFLPMPGWNNDDTAFTGTDINEFDFTENIIQAPRFAGLTVAPTEQTYAEIGCRVNGGELGTSPFCGASNNVVVASVSACAQQAAARGVDGFCYNRVTAGSFGGVCWITDPNTGNGIGLVDEMPTATSAQCMDDPNGDGVGQEGSGSDAFTCYRLTTPPATTQAACTFNAGDVVSGRWHRAIQTLEIEALQPVCMGTTMQLSFNGEDFGLHNPAGGFQGELAMNPEVADGCAAVVCAAPRIAAPAPVVQTVSTTETATVKAASSQSRALLAAGTFGAAAVVGSQAFGASALQTPLETDRSFASEWYSMDARGSDGVSQAQFLLPIEVELEVAAARAREYDQLQLGTGDANCNRQELRFRPYWWNEDTEQWVLLEQSSYDPATDLVRAPVPASVLNREDGKRYIVLSEHVTVSVPGCVPGSNTGGGGVPPVVPGNTPAPTSTPVSSDRDLDLAGAANDDDDDGLNGGEIAGIVLGVLAGLALLALLLLLCLKFCKPGGAAAPPPIAPPKVQTSQVVYMAKPAPVQQVEYEEVEVDVFEPTVQYVPVQPQHQTVQIVEQPMPMQQQVVTRQVPQMVTRNVAAPQNVVTVMGPGPNMPMGFSGPVTEQVNMQAMAHPVPFQGVM